MRGAGNRREWVAACRAPLLLEQKGCEDVSCKGRSLDTGCCNEITNIRSQPALGEGGSLAQI